MRLLPALLVPALCLTAFAHNGEYHPPLPPPKIEKKEPGARGATTRERPGTTTPGPDTVKPNDPLSSAPPPMPRPGPGVARDDARLTVNLWWEANRHRFLPPPPTLPMRDELIRVLLDAADAESHTVRDRALTALGRAGGTLAFHRILKECEAKDEEPRVAAILALGFLGDDSASPKLKKLVAAAETGVSSRAFAALAIGMIGNAADGTFLLEVLNEEWDPNIRSAAALGLGMLRHAKSAHALGRILLGAHPLESPELARLGDSASRDGLCAASAWALGRILTPRAYDYLVWALDSGNPAAATAAAMALANASGTAGLPSLRRCLLPTAAVPVRQCTLLGLAERGDPVAIEAAGKILGSEAERTGILGPFAAPGLGLAKRPESAGTLLAIAGDPDASDELRAAAVLGLGVSKNGKTRVGVEKAVASTRRPVIVSAGVIALALLSSDRALPLAKRILAESDLPGPRRSAVIAIHVLAPEGVVDVLVEELTDSYHVNREAALALARVDPRRAAAELTKKLSDKNLFARRFAAHRLGLLLARRRPGPLTEMIGQVNLLSGAPVLKGCLYLENELLYGLVRNF